MDTLKKEKYILTALRIALGWIFLWAFLDKTFGLGFATESAKSWLSGGSPTSGFLIHGTRGPFAEIFQSLAGLPVIDWLFMLGLLGIGITLIFGVAMRTACLSGIVMMALMWLAALPPENNVLIDKHIVYVLLLYLFLITDQQKTSRVRN